MMRVKFFIFLLLIFVRFNFCLAQQNNETKPNNTQPSKIELKNNEAQLIDNELNTTKKQEIDATENSDTTKIVAAKKKLFNLNTRPSKAAFYSTILPGFGQVYNKQIVKAPFYPAAMVLSFSAGLKLQNDFKKLNTEIALETNEFNRASLRMRQNQLRNLGNAAYAFSVASYGFGIADAFFSAKVKDKKSERHLAIVASYRSAMLPGLGQVYNKQAWKVPIIYTALAGSSFAVFYTLGQKNCYKTLFLNRERFNVNDDISASLANCLSESETLNYSSISTSNLLQLKQYWDRNLQWSVIIFAGIYALNIIDATVYGHLFDFKTIEDDLNVSIKPQLQIDANRQLSTGITLKINL